MTAIARAFWHFMVATKDLVRWIKCPDKPKQYGQVPFRQGIELKDEDGRSGRKRSWGIKA